MRPLLPGKNQSHCSPPAQTLTQVSFLCLVPFSSNGPFTGAKSVRRSGKCLHNLASLSTGSCLAPSEVRSIPDCPHFDQLIVLTASLHHSLLKIQRLPSTLPLFSKPVRSQTMSLIVLLEFRKIDLGRFSWTLGGSPCSIQAQQTVRSGPCSNAHP
jgi:hypothetical protein